MKATIEIEEGNVSLPCRQTGRATPYFRYLLVNNKRKCYICGVEFHYNLPEDFPNSK